LLLLCIIISFLQRNTSQTYAFINYSVIAEFCDFTYALFLYLFIYKILYLLYLTIANKQLFFASFVTYIINLLINLNKHKEIQTFYIINLSCY
jgi:hypothetical protein